MDLPARLDALDPRSLTNLLRESGHDVPDITALRYEPMPGVVGALGEVGIFTIEYAGDAGFPARLVGKCPLDDDLARITNEFMKFYERESGFYGDLAHAVPLRVARCWANLRDGQRYLLLLDHIEGTPGDILEGCSFDTMHRLVGDVARLHGAYWMDDRLTRLPWMLGWLEPSYLGGVPIVQGSWTTVTSSEPDLIPSDLVSAIDGSLLTDPEGWLTFLASRPWTFVHGDYELDNMVFPADTDPVVLDWQGCLRSYPGQDLASLLAASASSESVAREDELIDHYRDTLLASGGPAWSREDVVDDAAWALLVGIPGITYPYTQDYASRGPQGERAHARFRAFLERYIDAAVRWDTAARVRERL